jgi:hypothetical protein
LFDKGKAVLTDVVPVSGMKRANVRTGKGSAGKKTGEEQSAVRVLVISGGPVEGGRDRPGSRRGSDSGSKRARDEASRGLGGVEESEEVGVDEVVDEMTAEIKGVAGGKAQSKGWDGSKDGR